MIAESARHRTNEAELPPTASYGHRSLSWRLDEVPEFGGALEIRCGRKTSTYTVSEFRADDGRGFQVAKIGDDDQTYQVLISPDGRHVCDCLGHESRASERAANRSGEVHETAGCRHIDAVKVLVERNWI